MNNIFEEEIMKTLEVCMDDMRVNTKNASSTC